MAVVLEEVDRLKLAVGQPRQPFAQTHRSDSSISRRMIDCTCAEP